MPPRSGQSPSDTPRQKSVLFCPGCGHESPVDGDWQVRADADRLSYGCPRCLETVTERPARTNTSPVSSPNLPAGGSLLVQSVRLAFAWAAWPCTPEECALP